MTGKLLKQAAILSLLLAAGCSAPYKPSAWLTQVPNPAHQQVDPLPQTATTASASVSAGHDTYTLYCVACHGTNGLGRRTSPSLRTARIHAETDGDIHWILVHGSKGHGMPAWRSLSDTELWQLVQYIRALPPAPAK